MSGPTVSSPPTRGVRDQQHGFDGAPRELGQQPPVPPPLGARPHFVDRYGRGPAYIPSLDLQRLLQAIPASAGIGFSSQHLAALDAAIERTKPRPGKHSLDFRVSLPVLGRRYYMVLLGGKERRSRARLAAEGQDAARRLWIGYSLLVSVLFTASCMLGILLVYLVKSMLGMDLFDESSAMHELFFR